MNLEITPCPCEHPSCKAVELKGLGIHGRGAINREQAEFITAAIRLAENLHHQIKSGALGPSGEKTIWVDKTQVAMAREYFEAKKKAGLIS